MIPALSANFPVDGSDQTTLGFKGAQGNSIGTAASAEDERTLLENEALEGGNMLRLAQEAESQGATFFQTAVRSFWARNYRAYRSQHFEGSKYLHPRFSGRSKTFRPKTRDAVRKKMQAAATALFSTGDVVSITPENEADQVQAASATLKQELLNYRLSRETKRNGIKWFLIASGAVQTMQITGLCVSKQSWIFKEEQTDKKGAAERKNEQSFALSQTIPQAPLSMAGGAGIQGTMPGGAPSGPRPHRWGPEATPLLDHLWASQRRAPGCPGRQSMVCRHFRPWARVAAASHRRRHCRPGSCRRPFSRRRSSRHLAGALTGLCCGASQIRRRQLSRHGGSSMVCRLAATTGCWSMTTS